jgi:4-diphosphocytidyl-2-C-methyl-D-erythritol kinase
VRVRAFAKINRSLHVLGTRADGHHELRTVFQSIALHDTLTVQRRPGPFRLTCDDPNLAVNRSNLVVQAAEAAWKAAGRRGVPRDVSMHLVKRIPLQSGLGGGSSDAAATLRALARIWRVTDERIRTIAPALGADVPYFFEGGTVLGLERGDLLFPLMDSPSAWVVLALPDFGVSTRDAFAWFDAASVPPPGTEVGPGTEVVRNDLQPAVEKRHPEIARVVSALGGAGALQAAMSGSGSAVYGLFTSRSAAQRAAARVAASLCPRTLVTRTVTRAAYRRLAGT